MTEKDSSKKKTAETTTIHNTPWNSYETQNACLTTALTNTRGLKPQMTKTQFFPIGERS